MEYNMSHAACVTAIISLLASVIILCSGLGNLDYLDKPWRVFGLSALLAVIGIVASGWIN